MIKKITSIILALGMILGASVAALAYDDVTTTRQRTAVELVSGLGIMSPDSDDEFGSKTIVRRGEFALYVTRMMDYGTTAYTSGYFADVDTSTPEGAAIEMLVGIGAIPKTGTEYDPNNEITLSEAVRIILNCAGYSQLAATQGGYPQGYLAVAGQNSLLDGIGKTGDATLTKTETAQLLYNALLMYPMVFENNTYGRDDETLIEKIYDVAEVSGVITGYEKTGLYDHELNDGYVEINGTSYRSLVSDAGNYIGQYINGYVRLENGGERELVSFTVDENRTTVTEIAPEDLDSIQNGTVSYYEDGTRRRTLRYADNIQIIRNGRYVSTGTVEDIVSAVNEGSITFISNDGTNTANVLIIHDQIHMIVDRVDQRNYRIFAQDSYSDAEAAADPLKLYNSYTFDPDDDIDLKIYLEGNLVDFSEIKENDALSVEIAGTREDVVAAVIYISRETVYGTPSSISDETMTIDGTVYELSKYYRHRDNSMIEGSYALTSNGKIIGMVDAVRATANYAYVLRTYTDVPDLAFIRMFRADGTVVTYECERTVRINGDRVSSLRVPDYVAQSELITFRLNAEGKISVINRPYDATNNINYIDENDFVKNWSKSSVRYINGLMGLSMITDDTVIFAMPRFDRDIDSDYRVLNKEDLSNRTYSDITCYDVDNQGRAGAVVIVEDISDAVEMDSDLFFVKRMDQAVDEEGNELLRVTGFQSGEEVVLNFSPDTTTSITYEDGWMNYVGNEDFDSYYSTGEFDFHVGDALQYTLDNAGNVQAYRLVFNNYDTIYTNGTLDYDNPDGFFEDWSQTGSVTKQDFYDDLYIMYGDVPAKYVDFAMMCGLNANDRLGYESSSSPVQLMDYYRPFNLTNAYVYVYDVIRNELELGDPEDITQEDIVFARSREMGETNEIMVYVAR